MATKYESYETGDVGDAAFHGIIQRGQTFTPQIGHVLGFILIYCHRDGSQTGTVTIDVYACDGSHHPTGSILATGTFDPSTVDTSDEWVGIDLTGSPTLSASSEYCWIARNADAPDADHCIDIRVNTASDGYVRGELIGSNDGGSDWTVFDDKDYDLLFQEWSGTPPTPAVTVLNATNVTETTATGNGHITNLGIPVATQHGVCWNTTGTPTTADDKTEEGVPGAIGWFTSSITGLSSATYYYCRAYIINSAGTYYSAGQVAFVTVVPAVPVVTTQLPTDIRETTATGHGTITDKKGLAVTQHGHCWALTTDPTVDSNLGETELGTGSLGPFESLVTGLTANTTYYIRAYAVNTEGTGYGTSIPFKTSPEGAPIVTTQECSDIEKTTATGNGTIVDLGDSAVTQHGHCWALTINPDTTDDKTENGIGSLGRFESSITGLTLGALYYVRAYATNTQGTAYGDHVEIETGIPKVTTRGVTDIENTTATGNGTVNDLGEAAITQHGHCWNIFGSPTTSDNKTENGAKASVGDFTSSLTSLVTDTTYYIRAYATNAYGTGYGSDVVFETVLDAGISEDVFPINSLLRASGIVRTFWAGLGGQSVYQTVITMGGISTTYVSPISKREPPSAIEPAPTPSGAGYLKEDYLLWIKQTDWVVIIRMFGHFPLYEEWLLWRQSGGIVRW